MIEQEADLFSPTRPRAVALMFSGGLGSSILLSRLLDAGHSVQPIYVRGGQAAQQEEMLAVVRFLRHQRTSNLARLVTLDLSWADVYEGASETGPWQSEASPEQRSFVDSPGCHALATMKAALWCHLHGAEVLTQGVRKDGLAVADFPGYLENLQGALDHLKCGRVDLLAPLADSDLREIMEYGRECPLEVTFSCVAPIDGRHCGQCAKCRQRQAAFRATKRPDATRYAQSAIASS